MNSKGKDTNTHDVENRRSSDQQGSRQPAQQVPYLLQATGKADLKGPTRTATGSLSKNRRSSQAAREGPAYLASGPFTASNTRANSLGLVGS